MTMGDNTTFPPSGRLPKERGNNLVAYIRPTRERSIVKFPLQGHSNKYCT